MYAAHSAAIGKGYSVSVVQHLWKGRRVRVAGALDQVAVASRADMATVYEDYWDLVYRRCYGTLHDHEAALDTTQDVFVHALNSFDAIRHDIVRGLVDLARTLSYERKRRPAREVSLADPRGSADADPIEIAERHSELGAVWAGLSAVERRYLADKFAGFSFEEIAQRNRRALGTVSSNLARAREHARRMRGPTVSGALGLAGWRRFGDLGRRVRSCAQSSSTALAAQPVQALTFSLTVAGLIAGVNPGVAAPAGVGSMPRAALAVAAIGARYEDAGSAGTPAGSPQTGIPGLVRDGTAAGLGADARTPARPAVISTASAETPEDTQIYSAAPSPHYSADHTIIALGRGQTCQCGVVLLSTNGGATWTARQGPPSGNQVALPPDYPRDSRIFIGQTQTGLNGLDYWTPYFGGAYLPLAVPAGPIALPAGFDSGDARVIVSAGSAIWSLDWTTQVAQPIIIDGDTADTPTVAAAVGAASTGVLGISSAAALAPGMAAGALGAADGNALWTCPPNHACVATAEVPLGPGALLSVSPTYAEDGTILAYRGSQLLLSRDRGVHFQPVSGARDAMYSDLTVLGYPVAGTPTLWTIVLTGSHRFALEFAATPNGSWREVDNSLAQIVDGYGQIVPLGPRRVIFLSAATGFMCTANDGLSWSTRCPSI